MTKKNEYRFGNVFRWKIAHILNCLFQDTCWFDLAMWAAYPDQHKFSEIFEMRHTAGSCARQGEYNYCGKCDKQYPEAAFAEWIKRNGPGLTWEELLDEPMRELCKETEERNEQN